MQQSRSATVSAATYTSACETPSPRHNKAALLRACETPTMHANFSNCGTPSETCGWLAPTGACAAPAWARWPYLEPWVATIAFFVWIAVYKTLECGGDVRAAIKAQVDGDEKHVRIAGVGYFIGIYLFKQVSPPAEIDWSCPSPGFLLIETAVGVLAYDAIFYCLHRLMHAFAYRLHARHHSSGPKVNAQEVLNQDVIDASLQVLTNILVQRRVPVWISSDLSAPRP